MNQPDWQRYSLAEISTPASPSLAFGFGVDHRRMTFPSQGLDERLTGVEPARVIRGILA